MQLVSQREVSPRVMWDDGRACMCSAGRGRVLLVSMLGDWLPKVESLVRPSRVSATIGMKSTPASLPHPQTQAIYPQCALQLTITSSFCIALPAVGPIPPTSDQTYCPPSHAIREYISRQARMQTLRKGVHPAHHHNSFSLLVSCSANENEICTFHSHSKSQD